MNDIRPPFTVALVTEVIASCPHSDEERLKRLDGHRRKCGVIEPEALRLYQQIASNVSTKPRSSG